MLQLHWHLISSLWPPSSLLIQGIYIRFSLLFSMFCHSMTYIYWLPPQHLLPTSFLIVQFLLGYHVVLWRPTRSFRTNTKKKDVLFIRGDWNAQVGSWEIPGVAGKFGLGVQKEEGQRLTQLCQENTLVRANTLLQYKKWLPTWTPPNGQYQKLRWIIFYVAKDGEALYSQQNQDLGLAMAQIMSSLLQNSDLKWRK